jgi:hypothetical protein
MPSSSSSHPFHSLYSYHILLALNDNSRNARPRLACALRRYRDIKASHECLRTIQDALSPPYILPRYRALRERNTHSQVWPVLISRSPFKQVQSSATSPPTTRTLFASSRPIMRRVSASRFRRSLRLTLSLQCVAEIICRSLGATVSIRRVS